MGVEVSIHPPHQEVRVPEFNEIGRVNKLLYLFGKVTARTRTSLSGERREKKSERPLSLRTTRAKLYHEVMLTPDKNSRREIFAEAHVRDGIATQYLNQGEVTVTLPGLGEQTARYTRIEAPESRKTPETSTKPPIFLIPGISNDIDCVGALAQELPYSGRSVVVVGFPDSFMGSVTKEFAQAVEASPDYTPHTEFFKHALDALIREDTPVELWGFSTGSPIVEQILNDPKFQEKVTNAVLISPASVVDQTSKQLTLGTIKEIGKLLKRLSALGKYTYTSGREDTVPPEPEGQRAIKKEVFGSLLTRVRTNLPLWEQARVKEGGNIIVVSGKKDEMTKSYLAEDAFTQNPQIHVLHLSEGSHATPLTEPEEVLRKIFDLQRNAAIPK